MDIVAHASNVDGGNGIITFNKLNNSINSLADMIEVDLNITSDGKFVCVHNPSISGKKIHDTNYFTLKKENPEILMIEEVFEIVNNKKKLLLDIKNYGADRFKIVSSLVNKICSNDDVLIESFDLDLLKEIKDKIDVKYIILANLFSNYKKIINHEIYKDSFGVALASELFTFTNGYKNYLDALSSDKKMYAWTWTLIYKETEELFKTFINKGCDGIITDQVNKLVRMR